MSHEPWSQGSHGACRQGIAQAPPPQDLESCPGSKPNCRIQVEAEVPKRSMQSPNKWRDLVALPQQHPKPDCVKNRHLLWNGFQRKQIGKRPEFLHRLFYPSDISGARPRSTQAFSSVCPIKENKLAKAKRPNAFEKRTVPSASKSLASPSGA